MYDNFFKAIFVLSLVLLGTSASSTIAHAQDSRQDSLKNLLNDVSGEDRFKVYYELCRLNFEINDPEALRYALQSYEIALSLSDSFNIVRSARAIGVLHYRLDNLDESIRVLSRALGIAKRNNLVDQRKFILNSLALAYTHRANYDKALDCHFQSLVIRESEGNKSEVSIAYNNIGLVYYNLRDYDRGLEYFKKSEQIKYEINDTYNLDYCLVNIGLCYNGLSDFDQAIQYFNKTLDLCANDCSEVLLTDLHYAMGVAFKGKEIFSTAKEHFKISYDIAHKNDNKKVVVENLLAMQEIALQEGETDLALDYLKSAETLLENVDYNDLKILLYNGFARFHNRQNDFEKASIYQQKYIILKDSVYSGELIRNLTRIQTDFEERQNIATIASKEEALIRLYQLNIAIVIIAVLAALLVFVLYRSNQVKKKVNRALSDAKSIIEDQNRQLTSLNRNLEKMVDARTMELQVSNEALKRVNDELDNFIYKTSHDIRGPLASLKGMCNVAIMDVKDPLALEYFRKLDFTAEKLNTILTRLLIINQINNASASHEQINFEEIVDDVIVLEKKRGLPPKLAIRQDIEKGIVFYSDKELVRIILENLIDNAIKFYNDSDRIDPFVHIKIEKDGNHLRLRVLDNGIGISQVNPDKIFQMFSRASERSGTGGIGLYLTKTATEKIGGQIDLKTTPEGYTEFSVKFSLNTSKMRTEVPV